MARTHAWRLGGRGVGWSKPSGWRGRTSMGRSAASSRVPGRGAANGSRWCVRPRRTTARRRSPLGGPEVEKAGEVAVGSASSAPPGRPRAPRTRSASCRRGRVRPTLRRSSGHRAGRFRPSGSARSWVSWPSPHPIGSMTVRAERAPEAAHRSACSICRQDGSVRRRIGRSRPSVAGRPEIGSVF